MSYIDAQQQYSVSQALTVTAVSTNAIDHSQFRRLGIGEPLVIVISVGVSAAGGGTLTIQLQVDTTSAFGAPVTEATTAAIAAAALTAGAKVILPVPADLGFTRWSRLNYVLVTMTGITVSADIRLASAVQNEWYPTAGITVQ